MRMDRTGLLLVGNSGLDDEMEGVQDMFRFLVPFRASPPLCGSGMTGILYGSDNAFIITF